MTGLWLRQMTLKASKLSTLLSPLLPAPVTAIGDGQLGTPFRFSLLIKFDRITPDMYLFRTKNLEASTTKELSSREISSSFAPTHSSALPRPTREPRLEESSNQSRLTSYAPQSAPRRAYELASSASDATPCNTCPFLCSSRYFVSSHFTPLFLFVVTRWAPEATTTPGSVTLREPSVTEVDTLGTSRP